MTVRLRPVGRELGAGQPVYPIVIVALPRLRESDRNLQIEHLFDGTSANRVAGLSIS
jgi:hypothetical protein